MNILVPKKDGGFWHILDPWLHALLPSVLSKSGGTFYMSLLSHSFVFFTAEYAFVFVIILYASPQKIGMALPLGLPQHYCTNPAAG